MCSKLQYKINMVLMALVIIGAINWGAHAMDYNIVDFLSNAVNKSFKTDLHLNKVIYMLVAIAGIYLAFQRTTWLPFLGEAVLPSSLVPLKKPNVKTDLVIKLNTLPNVKIAYWASLNKDDKIGVMQAYGDYENSGVVMSDANGVASLPIAIGAGYVLPNGKKLERHIHYRVIDSAKYGMMDKLNTISY
jgi:uncharacterized membrane protein YuzA (DUF378 family)